MQTAVSVPDEVFEQAERLATRLKTSRSELYARALAEFIARHDDDWITAAYDAVVDEAGLGTDDFARHAARHAMRRVEW